MYALFPVFAAILQAGSFTLDKITLLQKRVTFRTYTSLSFPLSFLVTLGIFFAIRPPFSTDLFFGTFFWLLLGSILLKFFGNLIFYRALDRDGLGEMQIVELMVAIPVIIVTSILFTDERTMALVIPALVAASAVLWSHWERRHFRMKKSTRTFLLFSFFGAPLGAALSKMLLTQWHPVSLELVNSALISLLLAPYFFQSIGRVQKNTFRYLLATNVLTTIAWILFYTSYQQLGVVYTLLLFSLQPLLVYASSVFILKEKIQPKKVIAFGVVLVCIGAAQLLA